MLNFLKNILNKMPYIKGLHRKVLNYEKNACFPPGHYYSPIVSVEEIKSREDSIWSEELTDSIAGIELNVVEQLEWMESLSRHYTELPFSEEDNNINRYYLNNQYFTYTDGIILYSMLRELNPRNIIEVGSGFSSALMMDVNDLFLNGSINLSFIEPFPDRLKSLMKPGDSEKITLYQDYVQSVPVEVFQTLGSGDILFIDSSHVVKTGADVNHIMFTILPRLAPGVYIHFHDVFYPFEYLKEWVYGGHNWNEAYFLKAFLMYNNAFEIILFPHFLHKMYPGSFKNMPLAYKNHGGSFWIRKK